MPVINAILVAVASLAGPLLGIVLPLVLLGRIRGFSSGLIIGSGFAVLLGFMGGYVVASKAEEWLGASMGIPIGLFAGSLVGTLLVTCFSGGIGALTRMLVHPADRG